MSKEIEKIEKLAAKKKGDKITKYLTSKDTSVRIAAMKALGKCDGENGFNALINSLTDPEAEVRMAAAESLGETKKDVAFTHLSHNLSSEKDERVIRAMKEAMVKIRQATHGA